MLSEILKHEPIKVLISSPIVSIVSDKNKEPIEIVGLNASTLVPKLLDSFWASSRNKERTELVSWDLVGEIGKAIFSGIVFDDESLPAVSASGPIEGLNSWTEEADSRVMLSSC